MKVLYCVIGKKQKTRIIYIVKPVHKEAPFESELDSVNNLICFRYHISGMDDKKYRRYRVEPGVEQFRNSSLFDY